MKAYIFSEVSLFQGMSSSQRVRCYARALLGEDVEVECLNYIRTECKGVPLHKRKGVFDGIPYRFTAATPYRSENFVLRHVADYCDMFLACLFVLFKVHRGDVLISYHERFGPFKRIVIALLHLKGAKYFRELCELPYGTGTETPERIRLREREQRLIFPHCDGIIAISDAIADYARKYCRKDAEIVKIPILVDYDKYNLESLEGDVPYIFHSGALTEPKDGILGMIEAFGIACSKVEGPLRFVCTGRKEKSPCAKEIDALIAKYNLQDKVVFTGYLSDEQLKDYLQKASLVIINKYPNRRNTYCFSTKLGEYMAAGKAIIITEVGEAMNWLNPGKDALVIPPCDNEALAQAIIKLTADGDLRRSLGENARQTCRCSFDYHLWGRTMVESMTRQK